MRAAQGEVCQPLPESQMVLSSRALELGLAADAGVGASAAS